MRLIPQQAIALYEAANPYCSERALEASNYSASVDGTLVRLLDWKNPEDGARAADDALREFILGGSFACVAAKAAVQSGGYRFAYYDERSGNAAADGLARDLCAFVTERPAMPTPYATFIASFAHARHASELEFERAVWRLLQQLHDLDSKYFSWDRAVSSDPAAPNFAFSFAGTAFFVVGMHPGSSRLSRRLPLTALAFNMHSQFDRARKDGRYPRIQHMVRERELAVQGSLNPELRDFGARSEARQYSGRKTAARWKCPFKAR